MNQDKFQKIKQYFICMDLTEILNFLTLLNFDTQQLVFKEKSSYGVPSRLYVSFAFAFANRTI